MRSVHFTIVVAAFNAAATIGSAIRSVLVQTRQDFEVVVVDDGSTDGTAERAASFGGERVGVRVVRQPNRGPSAARNVGIAAARGSYVSILDADDLWLPEYLDVMGAALDGDREAAFAYTDAWVFDDTTRRIRRRSAMAYQRPPVVVPEPPALFLELLERNFVYTSVTARRSVLEAVGGYDETLSAAEDWELWLRIARSGGRAVRAPGLLAIHRERPGSLSSNGIAMTRSGCEVYRRVAMDATADDETRALAQRQLERSEKALRRLENRSLAVRLRAAAGSAKQKTVGGRAWFDRPPDKVESTLRAAGELP